MGLCCPMTRWAWMGRSRWQAFPVLVHRLAFLLIVVEASGSLGAEIEAVAEAAGPCVEATLGRLARAAPAGDSGLAIGQPRAHAANYVAGAHGAETTESAAAEGAH